MDENLKVIDYIRNVAGMCRHWMEASARPRCGAFSVPAVCSTPPSAVFPEVEAKACICLHSDGRSECTALDELTNDLDIRT